MNQKIIKICEQKFIYLNYSPRTRDNYLSHIKRFLNNVGDRQIIHLSAKDFQSYLDNYDFTSVSQQNQVINAIRFLYKFGLGRKYGKVSFKRPRREKKLPRVIDKEILLEKLSKVGNLKHKALLTLAYSTGLRVSEILNLKTSDIDSTRMLIHVKDGKGRKDRYVPLSSNVLHLLREYFRSHRPKEFLFEGQKGGKYSSTSCNLIVKKYLGRDKHMHLLRHSCFTSLLEGGTDLRVIQKIAGHSSSKTTEIYTHVSNQMLNQVRLPV